MQIPEDDSVRLLRYCIGGMDISSLERTYQRIDRNSASPRQMLAILVYAGMNRIFSSRQIETACRRDINFMYLLEGKPAPDYATIARFRSKHLAPCTKELFAQMDFLLLKFGVINLDSIFIDGTKIESVANKYKFVWKKTVRKNQAKLQAKLPDFVAKVNKYFGLNAYECANHKRLKLVKTYNSKTKTGYVSEKSLYACEDCKDCPLKKQCIHGNHWKKPEDERYKHLTVSRKFIRQRQDDLDRIKTKKGVLLRLNRAIQSEGTFADVKADLSFRRFLCKGNANVLVESMLLAMSHNMLKLHQKIQAGHTYRHLMAVDKVA